MNENLQDIHILVVSHNSSSHYFSSREFNFKHVSLSLNEPGQPSPAQSSDSNEGCSYPDTVEEEDEEEEEEEAGLSEIK